LRSQCRSCRTWPESAVSSARSRHQPMLRPPSTAMIWPVR
jgi:hypothetical protein